MLQSQFSFNVKFEKSLKKREIEGYASTPNEDRDGQMIPSELLKQASEKYLEMGTLLYEHGQDRDYQRRPVGLIFESSVDEQGRMYVKGKISDDWIWEKIELGELKAFSIGGMAQWENKLIKGKEIGVATYIDIHEVSIVSVPANSEAMFSIAKAFNKSYQSSITKNLYNKDILDNEQYMEDMLKNLQSKFEDFVSKDEEKKDLKKSVETLTNEKTELTNKIDELTKALEVEKANQEVLKSAIDELDGKLEKMISSKKKAKTDEIIEKSVAVEEEIKPEITVDETVAEVEKAYNLIFKR